MYLSISHITSSSSSLVHTIQAKNKERQQTALVWKVLAPFFGCIILLYYYTYDIDHTVNWNGAPAWLVAEYKRPTYRNVILFATPFQPFLYIIIYPIVWLYSMLWENWPFSFSPASFVAFWDFALAFYFYFSSQAALRYLLEMC